MKTALFLTAAAAFSLSACSMPGTSSSSSNGLASPGAKTLTINNRTVTLPTGYNLTSDALDGTTRTTTLVNGDKMPTNILTAGNATDFDVAKWCNDEKTLLTKSYEKGADITVTMLPSAKKPTGCTIQGHGKTASAGKNPTSGTLLKEGTPYSIMANIAKTGTNTYIAVTSRQLKGNYPFTAEEKLFSDITK